MFASGSQKYWHIINQTNGFEGQTVLRFLAFSVLGLGAIYSVCALCTYVWSLYECYSNPRLLVDEHSGKLIDETDEYEMIRKIVREELAAAQPIQVSLVKEEVRVTEQAPVVEEVKEEQPVVVEEPVKEEVVLNDHD